MKNLLIIIFILFPFASFGLSQLGYIKEASTHDKKGGYISGVKIKVANRNALYVSDSNGKFDIDGLGHLFSFKSIEYKDYRLIDDNDVSITREVTKSPITIYLISRDNLAKESENYYKKMYERILKENKHLNIARDKLEEDLRKKAERLAKVDFEQLSAIDQQIRKCLLQGEFDKADSLILSKGKIEDRLSFGKKHISSISNDLKILSENALLRLDYDTAIEYLEQIISIEPANIEVLIEISNTYNQYMLDFEKAREYAAQALFFAKRDPDNVSPIASCYECLVLIDVNERNFINAIENVRKCLALYNVANVPSLQNIESKNELDYETVGTKTPTSTKDIECICNAYSIASIIFCSQGEYEIMSKIFDERNKYNTDSSDPVDFLTWVNINMQLENCDAVIESIEDLLDFETELDESQVILQSMAGLCYAKLRKYTESSRCVENVLSHYKKIPIYNRDQYFYMALVSKSFLLMGESKYKEMIDSIVNELQNIDLSNVPFIDYTSTLLNNLGCASMEIAALENAEQYFLTAQQIIENQSVHFPKIDLYIYSNLGFLYSTTKDYDNAAIYLSKALSVAFDSFNQVPDVTQIIGNISEELYKVEIELGLYNAAFQSAILFFNISTDDNRQNPLEKIETCYSLASKSKVFKKSSEWKVLKSEYLKFKKDLKESNP